MAGIMREGGIEGKLLKWRDIGRTLVLICYCKPFRNGTKVCSPLWFCPPPPKYIVWGSFRNNCDSPGIQDEKLWQLHNTTDIPLTSMLFAIFLVTSWWVQQTSLWSSMHQLMDTALQVVTAIAGILGKDVRILQ